MSYWQDTSEMEQNLKNILVIQLRQLGDILLTTPVVRSLKEQYPEARVTFLCHPMGKMILDDNPYIDVVITYNPEQTFWEGLRFLKELRARSCPSKIRAIKSHEHSHRFRTVDFTLGKTASGFGQKFF